MWHGIQKAHTRQLLRTVGVCQSHMDPVSWKKTLFLVLLSRMGLGYHLGSKGLPQHLEETELKLLVSAL